jgi:5-methylcytosine-specific restriction endonuclease McrA
MWSRKYLCCSRCGKNDSKYFGKGLCACCYQSDYRRANAKRIAKSKRRWYEKFVQGTERQKLARDQRYFSGKRDAVLKRDGYKCVRCGSNEMLVVHHKDRSGRGSKNRSNNDLRNLETLCRGCHINEHRREICAIRDKQGWRRKKLNRWSRKWDACRRCGRTSIAHNAHGYCRACIRYSKTSKI